MGKMKELSYIAEAYENAVNYDVARGSGISMEDLLDIDESLTVEDKDVILDGWHSDYCFVVDQFRRFVEDNPEYDLIDDLEILAPNGECCGDCISAEDFLAFCQNH